MKRKSLPASQRVFTFVSASELLASKQPAAVVLPVKVQAISPAAKSPAPAPVVDPAICEFARDYAYPGASGRLCADGTFCASRIYGAAAIFGTCPTRVAKLREKAREQS